MLLTLTRLMRTAKSFALKINTNTANNARPKLPYKATPWIVTIYDGTDLGRFEAPFIRATTYSTSTLVVLARESLAGCLLKQEQACTRCEYQRRSMTPISHKNTSLRCVHIAESMVIYDVYAIYINQYNHCRYWHSVLPTWLRCFIAETRDWHVSCIHRPSKAQPWVQEHV